jgi:hypothetical protein
VKKENKISFQYFVKKENKISFHYFVKKENKSLLKKRTKLWLFASLNALEKVCPTPLWGLTGVYPRERWIYCIIIIYIWN